MSPEPIPEAAPQPAGKPKRSFIRRYWPLYVVAFAAALWWPAFNYLSEFRQPDIPFVTTPPDVVEAMLDLANVGPGDVVTDLGSGDGRIVIAAAKRGATAIGIEIDPELVEDSRRRAKEAGVAERVTINRGDIFRQDLSDSTVVTMFLQSNMTHQLRPQFDELKPGTRIVSHMTNIPGTRPDEKREVLSAETGREHTIYRWTTPLKSE